MTDHGYEDGLHDGLQDDYFDDYSDDDWQEMVHGFVQGDFLNVILL